MNKSEVNVFSLQKSINFTNKRQEYTEVRIILEITLYNIRISFNRGNQHTLLEIFFKNMRLNRYMQRYTHKKFMRCHFIRYRKSKFI